MKHHYPNCQGGPDCNCDERESEENEALAAMPCSLPWRKIEGDPWFSGCLPKTVTPLVLYRPCDEYSDSYLHVIRWQNKTGGGYTWTGDVQGMSQCTHWIYLAELSPANAQDDSRDLSR